MVDLHVTVPCLYHVMQAAYTHLLADCGNQSSLSTFWLQMSGNQVRLHVHCGIQTKLLYAFDAYAACMTYEQQMTGQHQDGM